MDEKEEDKSEESFQKHLVFYQKLNGTISEIEKEMTDMSKHLVFYQKLNGTISEIEKEMTDMSDEKLLKHLKERIEAIELDKTRIRKLFPSVDAKTWDGLD
jgi:DNA repair exonuclease SbcCD ATPase subunit